MFKSEVHNLIGNLVIWVLATITFFIVLHDRPLWFKIVLSLLMGFAVFKSAKKVYIEKRGDMTDSDSH